MVKIPPPEMVVMAALFSPNSMNRNTPFTRYTMDNLANEIAGELRCKACSHFIMHVFSNGGSFLWESIREIMNNSLSASSTVLNAKLSGIIFDSAPADFSGNDALIHDAMDFCSLRDRVKLRIFMKVRVLKNGNDNEIELRQQRAKAFWTGMKDCGLPVPHLYIVSKDDKLSPFGPLSDLIRHRETMMGKSRIQSCVFERSPHCRHILTYPKEYMESICAFLDHCFCPDTGVERSKYVQVMAQNNVSSRL